MMEPKTWREWALSEFYKNEIEKQKDDGLCEWVGRKAAEHQRDELKKELAETNALLKEHERKEIAMDEENISLHKQIMGLEQDKKALQLQLAECRHNAHHN